MEKYNLLTVIAEAERNKHNQRRVVAQCDCGSVKTYTFYNLKTGGVKSCGCLKRKVTETRHQMTNSRLYQIWENIIQRCTNPKAPNYHNYGGRGIKLCDEWKSFINFYEDMKEGYADELSIDRINNDGDYEKGNCRWATRKAQSNNSRNVLNAKGYTYCKKRNRFYAQINEDGKHRFLGYYDTTDEAHLAYLKAREGNYVTNQ